MLSVPWGLKCPGLLGLIDPAAILRYTRVRNRRFSSFAFWILGGPHGDGDGDGDGGGDGLSEPRQICRGG